METSPTPYALGSDRGREALDEAVVEAVEGGGSTEHGSGSDHEA